MAARLRRMAEAALVNTAVTREPVKTERSLVLDKLRRNLGLKAIKPAEIEWGGMKWHFAPVPATLDYWLYANLPEEPLTRTMHAPALGIVTGLVGLDDTPLYKVLNIPLKTFYGVPIPTPGGEEGEMTVETVPSDLHTKLCPGCSFDVPVDATTCPSCKATLDPMDVPVTLRIQYAEKMFDWFQNEFGPFERLPELWELMNVAVKSRSEAKDETYPLLDWSSKEKKTPSSTPGEE